MTLVEGFLLYLNDVIVFQNQSPKTQENHNICLRSLVKHFGDIEVEDLTFEMVRDWRLSLSKGRSIATQRNYVIKLRVVISYLYRRGYKVLDPASIAIPRRPDTLPSFVSREDVARLIGANDVPRSKIINRTRNKAIISLLYASGIRVSELCGLNIEDIKEDCTFSVIGKGHRARLCFFDERTKWFIEEYLKQRKDNDPALFLSTLNGRRITAGNVQEVFKNSRAKAGIKVPVHPHTMRHSFATDLMRNGMHLYNLQRLLGHANIETTSIYLHITDPQLQLEYAKYHQI